MKKLITALFISLIATFMVACGSNNNDSASDTDVNNANNGDNEENAEVENDAESSETITVEHELGETEVQKNPEKVVVFDFGSLDTLDELGIDITGVPQNVMPSYLEKYSSDEYENVGSVVEPDFEKVAEIDPDLIIISGRQTDVYEELQELGPTVYLGVDNTRYMDSFKENAEEIGRIFEKEDEVAKKLDEIDDHIAEVNEKAEDSGKNGLIIMANDDKISAYGPGSRFGLVHDVFGVPASDENIESSTHGSNISFEYVVEQDPDILYVINRGAAIGKSEADSAKQLVENDLMEDTKAMQNDNIVYLTPDSWYLSGGGLQSVNQMLDEVDGSLD